MSRAASHLLWRSPGSVGRSALWGRYEGLAGWLLARAKIDACPANPDSSCGIRAERYDAAIVDSYAIAPESICALARKLPIATIAEANRCPTCGVLLDYHLDRIEPSNSRLLAGPSYRAARPCPCRRRPRRRGGPEDPRDRRRLARRRVSCSPRSLRCPARPSRMPTSVRRRSRSAPAELSHAPAEPSQKQMN